MIRSRRRAGGGLIFPTLIQGKAAGSTARGTSFTVTFDSPAVAGNFLAVECTIERNNVGPTAAPSGWSIGYLNLDPGADIRSSMFYKRAAGGETSVTVSFGNNDWAYVFREIGLATGIRIGGSGTVGSSNAPNPPAENPGFSLPRLWFASAGFKTTSVSAYPSGYSDGLVGISTGNAMRMANAALRSAGVSEDPAAYGLAATSNWTSNTWAVERDPRGAPTLLDAAGASLISNYNAGVPAGVFDGVTNQSRTASIQKGSAASNSMYVGVTWATPRAIANVRCYGSNDQGYVNSGNPTVTLTLYGKNGAAPANGTDGTALGNVVFTDTTNESGNPRDIISSDPMTYWDHTWVNLTQANNAGVYMAELMFNGY